MDTSTLVKAKQTMASYLCGKMVKSAYNFW